MDAERAREADSDAQIHRLNKALRLALDCFLHDWEDRPATSRARLFGEVEGALRALGSPLSGPPLGSGVSLTAYASALSRAYRARRALLEARRAGERATIAPPLAYERWLELGGRDAQFRPLHAICDLARRSDLVERASLYGSVPAFTHVFGLSDLDLLFVVRPGVMEVPERLLALRELARQVQLCRLEFSPVTWHSGQFVPSEELSVAPERLFRSLATTTWIELIAGDRPLEARSLGCSALEDQEELAWLGFLIAISLRRRWDLVCVVALLSSVLNLPLRYLDSRGIRFSNKAEAFALYEGYLSPESRQVVERCSEIRRTLRVTPYAERGALMRVFRRLRRPALLSAAVRVRPANIREALRAHRLLGPNSAQRLQAFADDVRRGLPGGQPSSSPAPEVA